MMDVAARVAAAALRLLPNERREWGSAMAAELAQIQDPRSRLRFALGCMRASVFAPRSPYAASPGVAISTTMLAGVVSCIALTLYVMTRYPIAQTEVSGFAIIRFAVLLIAYTWLALFAPPVLLQSRRAVRVGAIAGIALAVIAPLTWMLETFLPRALAELVAPAFVILGVFGTFVVCAFLFAARERSFAAGLTAAFWAGIVSALLGFSIDLVGTVTGWTFAGHALEIRPEFATPPLAVFLEKHMAEHLDATMRSLVALPVMALALGAVGAAFGKRLGMRKAQ